MPRSVLATPPWRSAWFGLRQRPSLLLAAGLVGVVIGLVAAAPVLFVSSVGAGAVQVQWDRACPASVSPTLNALRPVLSPGGAPVEADDPMRRLVVAVDDDPRFATPEHILANYSATPVSRGGRDGSIGFLTRPDFLDHVRIAGATQDGDVWLPDTLAERLGARPGDTITVHFSGRDESLVVAGVFRDLALDPLDEYWCAAQQAIVPQNLYGEVFPPPMAMVTAETFEQRHLRGSLQLSRYIAPFAAPPRTLHDATDLNGSAQGLRDRVEQSDTGDSVTYAIDRLAARAVDVRDAVRDTTLPVAVLALVCAFASAGVLGALWMRVRRNSGIALATIGIGPGAIAAKAAVETVIPVIVGGAVGAALARLSMAAWAPSTTIEPGTASWALWVALAATAAGVLITAATAGAASRVLLRVAAPARRAWWRYVPFELVFLAVAVWAALHVRPDTALATEGRRVVDTDSSVLLLPLAVLALGASLTARAWWWVTARRRSTSMPRRVTSRLAVRRLQFGSRAGSAILGAGTLALGVSVFGLAMNASLARTAEAKAAVFVGGDTAVLIAGELPPGTPDATEVWTREKMEYAGAPADVIALDPDTFADVAFWDDAFADRTLDALLQQLADGGADAAILVGDAPDQGALRNPKTSSDAIDIRVIERVRTFPGASVDRPTLVTTQDALRDGPIKFRHFVWANGDYPTWRAQLQALGAQPMVGVERQTAIDNSVLRFAAWSFDFVRALGVFVGLLVVIALTLHLAARQRQQALAFAFLQRMGMSARRHWWALVLETAGLAAVMVALGVTLALWCARLVTPYVDPLPTLLPAPLTVVPWTGVAAVLALSVVVVLGGTAVAQLAGSRVDVSEVLRDGT